MSAMLEANKGIGRASKQLQRGAMEQGESLRDMPVALLCEIAND